MPIKMEIDQRPFAVEPQTNLMMPDGIFDTAIHNQMITCYIVNKDAVQISDVEIYLESVSGGIKIPARKNRPTDSIASLQGHVCSLNGRQTLSLRRLEKSLSYSSRPQTANKKPE